jgi:exosortase A
MKRDLEFMTSDVSAGTIFRAPTVLAVVLAVGGILALFWQTAQSIVAIWIRSETFAHGFVVIPICIWLVWRKRIDIASLQAKPWWPGLAAVFASGALWLVAATADVQSVKQFALAFMVDCAIVTVVGLGVARALAFPLVFLLFAIPTGEFLMPMLIDRTADFTVAAIRVSGVPVYREANTIFIPSGTWSVVEACSGIRYLIASVMVGTIYSAVVYRSTLRRALFMVASVVVPIVANWIRAYMIVMLGHLSNNKLAVGVDHLIYGWIFFGLVMALLFWIGSTWQEYDVPAQLPRAAPDVTATIEGVSQRNFYLAAIGSIVAAAVWHPLDAAVSHTVATSVPNLRPVSGAHDWTPSQTKIADWKPEYQGYVAELQQTFVSTSREVGLYVAYYRNQSKGRELVTSTNALASSTNRSWNMIASGSEPVVWVRDIVDARRAELRGQAARLDVFLLYWIAGRVTSNDYIAKVWLAWSKLTGSGEDSALIVIYAPTQSASGVSRESVRSFVQDMSPEIERALTAARESGH